MRRARTCAILLGGLASCLLAACQKPLSDADCAILMDRYTDLLIRSDRPGTTATERAKLRAEARAKALRDPEFHRCGSAVSRSQFDCAMDAPDVDSMERCLVF